MKKKWSLRYLGSWILCLCLLPIPGVMSEAAKPNIILVLVDDMGWTDVGCFGSQYYETPHIDRLCAAGMKFTQGYAACAVCSPTRAAVMTGRHPARLGITDWIHPDHNLKAQALEAGKTPEGYEAWPNRKLSTPINKLWLEHAEITLAEILKEAGYVTCHIGKWHLGYEPWWPDKQGFDFNLGGYEYGHPPSYFSPFENKNAGPIPTFKPGEPGEYLTDREAEEAAFFIRQHKDRPFFLYMAHYAVHTPIQSKPELRDKYTRKTKTNQTSPTYAGMVESVDDALGTIMSTLRELNLEDNTLVIFTSDNGGASHVQVDNGKATDNSPLRQGKGFPYEGGIRVPWIFHWPAKIKPGSICSNPVSSQDLLPTLCEVSGTQAPGDRIIDGLSLLPLLSGSGVWKRDTLYWHFPHYWWGGRLTPYSVIRQGEWKLIRHYEDGRQELFHLKTDISEKKDLAAREPDKVKELDAALTVWLKSVKAKLPKANPDFKNN